MADEIATGAPSASSPSAPVADAPGSPPAAADAPVAASTEAAPAPAVEVAAPAVEAAKETPKEPTLLEAADSKPKADKDAKAPDVKPEPAKESPAPAEAAKPDGDKPKDKDAAKAPDPAKEATAKEPPAPVKYEAFKVPDTVKLDDKRVEAFTGILNDPELKPQDRAQKLVDLYSESVQQMANDLRQEQRKTWDTLNDTWKTETRKELGNHVETDLAMAKAVIEEYGGTPEQVREYMAHMTNNGMGNYIGHVRLLRNIGRALGVFENSLVPANPTAPKMPKGNPGSGKTGWYDKGPGNGAAAP